MFADLLARLRAHLAPFHDPRALVLIGLCAGGAIALDRALGLTVLQWALPFGGLVGAIVIASRYVLPGIRLDEQLDEVKRGNTAAGLVVLGVCLFMGSLALALALWGKP